MINERKFINLIQKEYRSRLLEALSEVEVVDQQGNILISPDLKVRHKKSGYEYTVDAVAVKGDDDIEIVLRDPEDPRFEPAGSEELLGAPPNEKFNDILDETDNPPEEDILVVDKPEEETLFVVNKKDFEEEYEIK
jgi:hypothetical protein